MIAVLALSLAVGAADAAPPRNAWFFWPWSGTVLGTAKFTFIP